MIYGYCRISTKKQSIERQIRNILKEYPEATIFQEAFTGTKLDRPEWNRLNRKLMENLNRFFLNSLSFLCQIPCNSFFFCQFSFFIFPFVFVSNSIIS